MQGPCPEPGVLGTMRHRRGQLEAPGDGGADRARAAAVCTYAKHLQAPLPRHGLFLTRVTFLNLYDS